MYWTNLPAPRESVQVYAIRGDDDALVTRVVLIARKLAAVRPLPVDQVFIITSDFLNAGLKAQGKKGSASPINAGAYRCGGNASPPPSGCIYVGNVFVKLLSDNALAGILAHEIGHLERGHKPSPDLAAALGLQRAGQDVCTKQADTRNDAIISAVGCGISAFGIGASALAAGYSRDVERETDASAISRLFAAGYCAGPVMQKTFAELSNLADSLGRSQASSPFDAHPSLRERWQVAGNACEPTN